MTTSTGARLKKSGFVKMLREVFPFWDASRLSSFINTTCLAVSTVLTHSPPILLPSISLSLVSSTGLWHYSMDNFRILISVSYFVCANYNSSFLTSNSLENLLRSSIGGAGHPKRSWFPICMWIIHSFCQEWRGNVNISKLSSPNTGVTVIILVHRTVGNRVISNLALAIPVKLVDFPTVYFFLHGK